MKTLILMRHAKSSWDDATLDDYDRPLNSRGFKDAPRMGKLLKQKKTVPDLILCSPARRARQTCELFVQAAQFQTEIEWKEDFYGASPAEYLKGLQAVDDACRKVMLIGHNPGMESLLHHLNGEFEKFPTAAIAILGLPIEHWQALSLETKAQLQHLWRPKDI